MTLAIDASSPLASVGSAVLLQTNATPILVSRTGQPAIASLSRFTTQFAGTVLTISF